MSSAEDDPRTPLVVEKVRLRAEKQVHLRVEINGDNHVPRQSNFLSVPSPIYPTSTPLGIPLNSFGEKALSLQLIDLIFKSLPGSSREGSFSGDVPRSGRAGDRTILENTRVRRRKFLGTVVTFLTEVLLPLATALLPLAKIIELFWEGHHGAGGVGVGLYLLPTFLILGFYLENMVHRERKALELGLITALGPFLRWVASLKLLLMRYRQLGHNSEIEDLEIFISATKMIDGVFQPSVQMVFMLYLMAVGVNDVKNVRISSEMFSLNKEVTDFSGNVIPIPELSNLNLYTSTAVLVKNITQLWMANFPRSTTESGSEAIVTPDPPLTRSRKFLQWTVLVMFVVTVVAYRLLSYTILCLHLNYFFVGPIAIIVLSFFFHVLLRGLGDQFFVNTTTTSKTDVFLTACCSSLVPTPTSADIRAHNLLQVHTVVTNLVMFIGLGLCMFLNLDYYLPIISRPEVQYDHTIFFSACLVVIALLPLSLFFYWTFKKLMGQTGQRKTFFWTDTGPTWWSILTGTVSFLLLVILVILASVGHHSGHYCQPPPHLQIDGLSSSIGWSVQCNTSTITSHRGKNILCLSISRH